MPSTLLLLVLYSVSSVTIYRPATAYYNETLIKNITQLLDTLLDNYDAKLRPGHGSEQSL